MDKLEESEHKQAQFKLLKDQATALTNEREHALGKLKESEHQFVASKDALNKIKEEVFETTVRVDETSNRGYLLEDRPASQTDLML